MSRICLVDSGSCARASRSLQVHRGYWHYPWYFDTKLPYNYIPIRHSDSSYKYGAYIRVRVVQNIVHEVEKSEKFYSGDPPQIKNPERSAKGHANPSCTTLEFWSKTHLDSHRSSPQTQLGNFAVSYRRYSCTICTCICHL